MPKAGAKFFAADAAETCGPGDGRCRNTIEAEDLWVEDLGQSAQLLPDDGRQYEFSRGLAVGSAAHKAGYGHDSVFRTIERVWSTHVLPGTQFEETPAALMEPRLTSEAGTAGADRGRDDEVRRICSSRIAQAL